MNAHNERLAGTRRTSVMLLGVVLFLVPALALLTENASSVSAHDTFADPAFQRVWNHCDKPVEAQIAARSWMWGPEDYYTTYEPYAEGPGGRHLVSYFDKSRMEINDPGGNRSSEWFVTNGLLVVDMMAGRIQVGDNLFVPATPADIPVAGDVGAMSGAPTYATLARVASLNGNNRAPDRTGQYVREGMGSSGNTGMVDTPLSTLTRYSVYEPTLGHNIPDLFWAFMNRRDVTYHDSGYMTNDTVVDWIFAMGYPVTEPYWVQISVNGQQRWVLMQAFQRRVLTYSPYNPDPWKVEMANVGRAYFDWRYGSPSSLPTLLPTTTPAAAPTVTPRLQASISIDPTAGDTNTLIRVQGSNFPAVSGVTIRVEKPSAGYSRDVAAPVTNADGAFAIQIRIPGDAARLGDVQITAVAHAGAIPGAVRASQTFRLSYQPAITVSPREVVPNGTLRVQGEGFPAGNSVRLGMIFENGMTQWSGTVGTDGTGAFDTKMSVGNRAAGTRFSVLATMDGGYKAVSIYKITVIAQPALQVVPISGPAGVYVTLKGSSWQPNRDIQVGIRAIGSSSEAWWPDPVTTDAAGSFSKQVWVGPEYRPYSEVRLMALEGVSATRLEASYRVANPPAPTPTIVPAIIISPTVLTVGQEVTVYGRGWPANASISLGIGRTIVEEPVGMATGAANGTFTHCFLISSRWQAGGQLTLTAWVPIPRGPSASATIWVGSGAGRVTPSGLSMWVTTYQYKSDPAYIKVRGEGWTPGQSVSLSIISADGALNIPVDSATIGADGIFRETFAAAAPWWGRADVGVRAISTDGRQSSIRYLPYTEAVKVAGGTYRVHGVNWPASMKLSAIAHIDTGGGLEDVQVGATTSGPEGVFELQVQMPRMPTNNKNDLEIIPQDQPYGAILDL